MTTSFNLTNGTRSFTCERKNSRLHRITFRKIRPVICLLNSRGKTLSRIIDHSFYHFSVVRISAQKTSEKQCVAWSLRLCKDLTIKLELIVQDEIDAKKSCEIMMNK